VDRRVAGKGVGELKPRNAMYTRAQGKGRKRKKKSPMCRPQALNKKKQGGGKTLSIWKKTKAEGKIGGTFMVQKEGRGARCVERASGLNPTMEVPEEGKERKAKFARGARGKCVGAELATQKEGGKRSRVRRATKTKNVKRPEEG